MLVSEFRSREAVGLWENTWSIQDELLSQLLIMENIKKTCLLMDLLSVELLVNHDVEQLLFLQNLFWLFYATVLTFMTPGAA